MSTKSTVALACAVAIIASASVITFGEVGGGHLIWRGLTTGTLPDNVIAEAQPGQIVPATRASKVKILTNIVSSTVQRAEKAIRREPPANATNAQRQSLREDKLSQLKALADEVPAVSVTATLTVTDVQLAANVLRPEAEDRPGRTGKYLVFGRVEWMSEAQLTDNERQQIARINSSAEAQTASARSNGRGTQSGIAASVASIEKSRSNRVKAIKEAAATRLPVHVVYLFTDDDEVFRWKRGETRTVKGVIQAFGLFIYGPNSSSTFRSREGGGPASNGSVLLTIESAEALSVGTETVIAGFPNTAFPVETGPSATQGGGELRLIK